MTMMDALEKIKCYLDDTKADEDIMKAYNGIRNWAIQQLANNIKIYNILRSDEVDE